MTTFTHINSQGEANIDVYKRQTDNSVTPDKVAEADLYLKDANLPAN